MENNRSLIGKEIFGKYRIMEKIGSGGMATVYKALQKNLDRHVALKIVHENLVDDRELISRFIREARDMARISHPNVVTVYDFGNEDNIYFIAMEYLEGRNLSSLIRQQGRLDEKTTIKYIAPIADALDHIHRLRFIHRDVKSSNIFITQTGRPVLMDFGIAYHSDKTISDTKTVLGTAEYMSPEQTRGSILDVRSDIYSLGIVLYECLAGELPFRGDSLTSTIYKVNNEPPPSLREYAKTEPWLEKLVMEMLEKRPEDRTKNARMVFEQLEEGLNTGSLGRMMNEQQKQKKKHNSSRKHTSTKKPLTVRPRRSPLIWVLIVLAIVLLVPVIVWATGFWDTGAGTSVVTGAGVGEGQQRLSPVTDVAPPSDESAALSAQANQAFAQGDHARAHRIWVRIGEAQLSESELENMQRSRKIVLDGIAGSIGMAELPGGQFVMGEENGSGDNAPAHRVELDPYTLSVTEITLDQFITLVNTFHCDLSGQIGQLSVFHPHVLIKHIKYDPESGFIINPGAGSLPAYGVTWTGADFFCRQMGGRLPTEAEWEFAARSGEATISPGNELPVEDAWYNMNTTSVKPVGSLAANTFGLHDIRGNVWEWCADYYNENYYEVSPIRNPPGPPSGDARVIRGGDIKSPKPLLSATYRSFMYEDKQSMDLIGFRMCRNQ